MSQSEYLNTNDNEESIHEAENNKPNERYWLHILLFLLTFFSTCIAGVQWANRDFTNLQNIGIGLTYSLLLLSFLTAHEFGHYFAAKYHKVSATLPYYIPLPIPYLINFGTMGAVIKTREPIGNRKALFDIGIAGPLAGFVVSLIILIYGLATLPGIEFIYKLHPEYITKYNGQIPKISLFFGDTMLFSLLAKLFANPHGFMPPMNEIYHYPFLCVGWFGLFVTTLNMLPIGQLDGGHITYAMFGYKQHRLANVVWWLLIALGVGSLLGLFREALLPDGPGSFYILMQRSFLPLLNLINKYAPWFLNSWAGWILWALITKFFIKIKHPYVPEEEPLGPLRKTLGWLSLIILTMSFSYNGIYII